MVSTVTYAMHILFWVYPLFYPWKHVSRFLKNGKGYTVFSQFPVVFIFFHSFLWYLVIQHLKDLLGCRSHNSTMFPAWRHNSFVTLVTTPEEVNATQSRAQKHLGWHRREAGIQKGVFSSISYLFPSFYVSLTKLKNTKKKSGIWFPHAPVTQLQNPSTQGSAFIYSPSASSLPHNNGNISRQLFAMILFHS